MSDWDLMLEGRTVEAIQRFEEEFEKTGQTFFLYNAALGFLDLGQLEQARNAFLKIIRLADSTSESHAVFLGTVEWMMGNTSAAIESWRKGQSAEYRDAAGGIASPSALWYAGIKLGDPQLISEAERSLRRFWGKKDVRPRNRWPGVKAIAGYLLGSVSTEDFLENWKDNNAILEIRRICRAYFWVAVKSRALNTPDSLTTACLRSAANGSRNAILEYEFFLSRWELSQLRP